jgi:hypothetical protein
MTHAAEAACAARHLPRPPPRQQRVLAQLDPRVLVELPACAAALAVHRQTDPVEAGPARPVSTAPPVNAMGVVRIARHRPARCCSTVQSAAGVAGLPRLRCVWTYRDRSLEKYWHLSVKRSKSGPDKSKRNCTLPGSARRAPAATPAATRRGAPARTPGPPPATARGGLNRTAHGWF